MSKLTKAEKEERKYNPKTDEEIKNLALDFCNGRIFTSLQIHPNEQKRMLSSVFMVLAFMKKEQIEEMQRQKIQMVYADMSEAMKMSVNGYPIFFSCAMLNDVDTKRFIAKVEDVKKQLANIK